MLESEEEILKECSCCHELLPLSSFYKQSGRKYGVRSNCKKCVYSATHSDDQLKRIKEYSRKYQEENKEQLTKKRKEYYERTKEERKQKNKKYYEEHKEEKKAKDREYYLKNKEKRQEYAKQWRENNKDLCVKWAENNREKKKNEIYAFKKPCEKCGENRLYLIQFHHIEPSKKISEVRTAGTSDKRIEEIKKCVCLCANCHIEFHHFYGNNPQNPKEALDEYLSEVKTHGI